MGVSFGDILYYARFKNHTRTRTYRVEIRKKDYNGAATEIINLSDEPLIYSHSEQNGSEIQGAEVKFSFVVQSSDYDVFDQLTQGDDFDYRLAIIDDRIAMPSGAVSDWVYYENESWAGFILPSETSRGYFDRISILTITATCYLARLKHIPFSTPSGAFVEDRMQPVNIIGHIIGKIQSAQFFMVVTDLEEANAEAQNPLRSILRKVYIDPRVFVKIRNGVLEQDTCYEVLDNLCKVFFCNVFQPLKRYEDYNTGYSSYNRSPQFIVSSVLITNASDDDCGVFEYLSESEPAYPYTPTAPDIIVNIDNYKFKLESEYSRKSPLRSIELIQQNKDFGEPFTTDDLKKLDNTTLWSRSGVTSITANNSYGSYSIVWPANSTALFTSVKSYLLSNTYGNSFIRFLFLVFNTSTWSYTSLPSKIRPFVQVKRTTSSDWSEKDYGQEIGWLGRTVYESPASEIFEIEDGALYNFRIGFEAAPSGQAASISFLLNWLKTAYVNNGKEVRNLLYDTVYKGYIGEYTVPQKKVKTKIGDSDIDTNASAITYRDNLDYLTDEWSRSGVSESKPIQHLILQSYFNRFAGNSRVLKLTVYDPEDTISLLNKLELDSKTYKILDIEKSFKTGWVQLRLLKISTVDVNFNYAVQQINSTNQTKSTSSGGAAASSNSVASHHNMISGRNGPEAHPEYAYLKGNNTFEGYNTFKSDIRFNNINTRLQEGSSNSIRNRTNYGYIDVGPKNSSHGHIYTDRADFYFNKPLFANDFHLTSDARLKKDISKIKNVLPKILEVKTVEFSWKKISKVFDRYMKGRDVGYIAQQLENLFPKVVNTGKDGVKSISYSKMSVYNTRAIIELFKLFADEVDRLNREIEQVKKSKK